MGLGRPLSGLRLIGESYLFGQAINCSLFVCICSLAGLLGLILLTILSALIIKYRKDRLRWFVQDGAATRPDLRTFVPIAWSAYCILLSAE